MKKVIFVVMLFSLALCTQAQDEKEEKEGKEVKEQKAGGFQKENLFTGGNLNASFFNGTTALGISPFFGYSLTNWMDVAVSFNVSYISQRDVSVVDDKLRQTVFAPGALVRLFPVNFLFAQAQLEHNFLTQTYVPAPNSGYSREKYKTQVNSLLLGIGYASGREYGNKSFYFISVSYDVLGLANSPYVDSYQHPYPIVNAGFNIALFQGRNRGY